ncbi:uncharacterized protein LOC103496373 isoform X2 [Cucumis melo]|uniref:Uncharacterized protein LOC103496373 isoform X2 n=1 Tax=Cucumis melo TaxID=3656 RepID=A0ABM3LBU2_CUCME|nr:uncharacterized protein LOC103496373 isoform X2 [Cucumis melo]
MDVKGIAWVGRLYEKFETMCLEVEDIICQDTVKYVENQVEVVGASVKRFYSDVMQDFLPPSELSDEKVAVCNSALENYENVVICKKPTMGMKIERSKFSEEKSNEYSKETADAKRDIICKLPRGHNHANNLYLVSSPYSAANRAQIDGYSRKKDDENIHHKIDLDSRESTTRGCKSLTETSPTNLEIKYENDASSCCAILNRKSEASSELAGNTETIMSVKDTRYNSVMQSSNETEIRTDNILSDTSSNSIVGTEETRLLSYGDSSAELDGRSDSWSPDDIELEHGTGNIQQADETKLDEEACVLVNRDDLHFDFNEEVKQRHYKKIAGAFSFTKKSKRKQEYKELAMKHGYGFGRIPNHQDKQKLTAEDVSELDWQLL